MAQTYKQIQKQIEQLQRQAETLRTSEIKGVVERIKVAIAHYGLTAAHLGLAAASPKSAGKRSAKASTQFSDGAGNSWSGRGPRPRWLREALAAGRSIEEFRSGATPKSSLALSMEMAQESASTKKSVKKKTKRAPSKVNYTDGAGNSWTGRGPKPGWLKAALDSGKTLQDFVKQA
ncbi:H-NS family nucleoid-associated regulatory protein [Variovorax sp. J22P168]|uniref:H-NS family nucleoid-associated regulatory protein n=1 Tax=Variovorax jilinensis TaxID=3053513 RepID=UPI002577D190|nr:H-NS family nucleoid-associated regulatory protein [Variovorax sp. J22P168]MDM0015057.1 H-NS family nucleoid-associated regulatory protein [Variovorax sp. J22P168]